MTKRANMKFRGFCFEGGPHDGVFTMRKRRAPFLDANKLNVNRWRGDAEAAWCASGRPHVGVYLLTDRVDAKGNAVYAWCCDRPAVRAGAGMDV